LFSLPEPRAGQFSGNFLPNPCPCPKLLRVPLHYTVRFGDNKGLTLRPHRFRRGYRASKTALGPHAHVATEEELITYLRQGWSIRMSGTGHAPSLIRPEAIAGWR
jgi:hypothetical protein